MTSGGGRDSGAGEAATRAAPSASDSEGKRRPTKPEGSSQPQDPQAADTGLPTTVAARGPEETGSEETRRTRHTWSPAVIAAVVALCLAVTAAVLYIGGRGDSTPDDGSPEVGFARDMAVHHQQAVEMSFIIMDRTDDEKVRTLAYDIANTQANQRGMMLGWLDLWGLTPTSGEPPMAWMGDEHAHRTPHDGSLMPGMATKTQIKQLGKAKGEDAEVLFLQLMIDHHKGGVDMAKSAVNLTDQEQVEELAQGMVDSQRSEIDLMNEMLRERGAEPVR